MNIRRNFWNAALKSTELLFSFLYILLFRFCTQVIAFKVDGDLNCIWDFRLVILKYRKITRKNSLVRHKLKYGLFETLPKYCSTFFQNKIRENWNRIFLKFSLKCLNVHLNFLVWTLFHKIFSDYTKFIFSSNQICASFFSSNLIFTRILFSLEIS